NIRNAATAIATPRSRPPDALDARTTRRKTSATWALSRSCLNANRIAAAATRLEKASAHVRPRERLQSRATPVTTEIGLSTDLFAQGEPIPDSGLGEDVAGTQRIGFDLSSNVRNVNAQILLRVAIRP